MRSLLQRPSMYSQTQFSRMFSAGDLQDDHAFNVEDGHSFLDNFDQSTDKNLAVAEESDMEVGVEFETWNMQELGEPEADEFVHEVRDKFQPVGGEKELRPQKRGEPGMQTPPKEVEMERDEYNRAMATGIRKASKATVYLKEGSGEHYINGIPYTEYLPEIHHRMVFLKPFQLCNTLGQFDVWAEVSGGGFTGQTGAIRLGISKALQQFNPAYRRALRKGGMLTVDIRKVERKKPGRKKARKLKQWVKR